MLYEVSLASPATECTAVATDNLAMLFFAKDQSEFESKFESESKSPKISPVQVESCKVVVQV